jgi:glycosyltransferase involved in cell wall biosynthesis
MYKNYKICVIVPAFNEEALIIETLNGIPEYVDKICVINDASTDNTFALLKNQKQKDCRIEIINHIKNEGLGKSLIDGYKLSKINDEINITAVMASDNQMHPDDLVNLLDKIIDEEYDYIKGNRLLHIKILSMPKHRFIGNSILTILTKFATGYYSLMDPQCGYTAIRNSVLKKIPIEKMTKGYGYNADILCMLNIQRFKVSDVEVQPIYDKEKSKIKLWKYIPKTSGILINLFFRRLWQRYIVLDFHPLVLFYLFALFNMIFIILPLTIRFFVLYFKTDEAPKTTLVILVFSILMTFQSILFAIWMDMDYNKKI